MRTPDDYTEIISERLITSIMRDGRPYWQIARLSGVSKNALEQYMYHKRMPSAARLASICHTLGVNPAWIMGLSGLKII